MFDHEAIEKFQKSNGLTVDGWLGPKGETIQKMQKAAGIAPDSKQKPPAIKNPDSIDALTPKIESNTPTIRSLPPPEIPPYIDQYGNIIIEGINPNKRGWISPGRKL